MTTTFDTTHDLVGYCADLLFEVTATDDYDRAEVEDLAVTITEHYTVGEPVTPAILFAFAIVYAINGWEIFPLNGKTPAIPSPHPKGFKCDGQCGRDGHGVLDATTDLATIIRWWRRERRGANIGGRVPESLFVLDSDPRKDGHASAAAALTAEHGPMPHTHSTLSGRMDGGLHRFYRRPAGKLHTANLGPGFDIKDHAGYVVMPPSIHPDTGLPYLAIESDIVAPPDWLADLIVASPPQARTAVEAFFAGTTRRTFTGDSVLDQFSASTSWTDILEPYGWVCKSTDPDADGAEWLHPTATSKCSATVRHACLFVYSTNTPFEVTTPGERNGYTRFRAYAVLNYGGDLSAAARSLRKAV